ncbi:MAG: trigger factor [Rhodospirillales bacterium]
MEVTETKTDSLLREYTIEIPAQEIEQNVLGKLAELSHSVSMPGFRPGKVPVSILRKKYGANVMQEVLQHTVTTATNKVITDNELRPAMQPKIDVTEFKEGDDLKFTLAVELMPEIALGDLSKIELERLVYKVDDKAIEESLTRLADAYRSTRPAAADHAAQNGEVVVIDFVGKVDGEEFPGGKAQGYSLELGTGSFVPGFEEQLIGAKAGDAREVKVTFPKDYPAETLAGKDTVFDVTVKEVQEKAPASVDDELAKKLGKENLDQLRQGIKEEQQRQYQEVAQMRLKRALLDKLAENYEFEIPPNLAASEFDAIWQEFETQREQNPDQFKDDDKDDETRKEELREIAARRVKLGLVMAEVGRQNKIELSQEDINRGVMAQARRYPGREKEVMEHFSKSPEALQSITAPLYEDKVVEFILALATVKEKEVSLDELMATPDDDESGGEGEKSDKKKAAKKKAAPKKKAAAKK